MKPKRLGRGLEFLLAADQRSASGAPPDEHVTETSIPVEDISANPWQPRTSFDEASIEELAASIRLHGILQPLVVRRLGDSRFELVAGERRFLAAKRAGLLSVPALVRDVDDRSMLILALIENLQREDLNPLDRARAYDRLSREHGLSHQRIAEVAGVGRSTITNCLRLLDLDQDMLESLQSRRLTEGHARALLLESDPDRRKSLFKRVMEGQLSVREIEQLAGDAALMGGRSTKRIAKSPEALELEKRLSERLGMRAVILEKGEKGRLTIEYGSLEDFERLYTAICGESPAL